MAFKKYKLLYIHLRLEVFVPFHDIYMHIYACKKYKY